MVSHRIVVAWMLRLAADSVALAHLPVLRSIVVTGPHLQKRHQEWSSTASSRQDGVSAQDGAATRKAGDGQTD